MDFRRAHNVTTSHSAGLVTLASRPGGRPTSAVQGGNLCHRSRRVHCPTSDPDSAKGLLPCTSREQELKMLAMPLYSRHKLGAHACSHRYKVHSIHNKPDATDLQCLMVCSIHFGNSGMVDRVSHTKHAHDVF